MIKNKYSHTWQCIANAKYYVSAYHHEDLKHILWIFKCADYQITYFIFYCLHFRKQTFTSKDIFNFCWILYVRTKGNLSLSLFSYLFCICYYIIYISFLKLTFFMVWKIQLYFYFFAAKFWNKTIDLKIEKCLLIRSQWICLKLLNVGTKISPNSFKCFNFHSTVSWYYRWSCELIPSPSMLCWSCVC